MADVLTFPPTIIEYPSAFVIDTSNKPNVNNVEFIKLIVAPARTSSFTKDSNIEVRVIQIATNEIVAELTQTKTFNSTDGTITITLTPPLPASGEKDSVFTIDALYKAQVRTVDPVSEWSTPVVMKYLGTDDFENNILNAAFPITLKTTIRNGSKEKVIGHKVIVTKGLDGPIIEEKIISDLSYSTGSSNEQYYTSTYMPDIRFDEETIYRTEFRCITENGYMPKEGKPSTVTLLGEQTEMVLLKEFSVKNNYDYGYIDITCTFANLINENIPSKQGVLWRRNILTESAWQKLVLFPVVPMDNTSWSLRDTTVENGQMYQYAISVQTWQEFRGTYAYQDAGYQPSNSIMCEFEDMFLITGDHILPIRYDPKVSSWKKVVQESITNTLGSKYPFIRRSGNVNYQQFQIGGLLSCRTDEMKSPLEVAPTLLVAPSHTSFDDYNNTNNITYYNDIIKEKLYRQIVTDFLEDSEIKLFKSPTEGNVLVHLGQVTFTPNDQIGRVLHSFTAQATEIGACSIDNLIKYNIITSPEKVEAVAVMADGTETQVM